MFDVENVPPELLLLGGSRLCMGTLRVAAGGGAFFSTIQLQNPFDSGFIMRCTGVIVRLGVSGRVNMGPTQNTLSQSQGATAFADSRVFGEGTVGAIQGANNNLVTGSTFLSFNSLSTESFILTPPAGLTVLAPGGRFEVSTEVANDVLLVSFLWVERIAEPSELNL